MKLQAFVIVFLFSCVVVVWTIFPGQKSLRTKKRRRGGRERKGNGVPFVSVSVKETFPPMFCSRCYFFQGPKDWSSRQLKNMFGERTCQTDCTFFISPFEYVLDRFWLFLSEKDNAGVLLFCIVFLLRRKYLTCGSIFFLM